MFSVTADDGNRRPVHRLRDPALPGFSLSERTSSVETESVHYIECRTSVQRAGVRLVGLRGGSQPVLGFCVRGRADENQRLSPEGRARGRGSYAASDLSGVDRSDPIRQRAQPQGLCRAARSGELELLPPDDAEGESEPGLHRTDRRTRRRRTSGAPGAISGDGTARIGADAKSLKTTRFKGLGGISITFNIPDDGVVVSCRSAQS